MREIVRPNAGELALPGVRAASRQLDNGRGELRLALSQIADVAGWITVTGGQVNALRSSALQCYSVA
jgi:hypothetical protein